MSEVILKESIEVMYKHVENMKNLNKVVLEKFFKESIEVMLNHMDIKKNLENMEKLKNHEAVKMKRREAALEATFDKVQKLKVRRLKAINKEEFNENKRESNIQIDQGRVLRSHKKSGMDKFFSATINSKESAQENFRGNIIRNCRNRSSCKEDKKKQF